MSNIREGEPLTRAELCKLIDLIVIGGRNIDRAQVTGTVAQVLSVRNHAYRKQISLLELHVMMPDAIRSEIREAEKLFALQAQQYDSQ